jgi:hypothetical protein
VIRTDLAEIVDVESIPRSDFEERERERERGRERMSMLKIDE